MPPAAGTTTDRGHNDETAGADRLVVDLYRNKVAVFFLATVLLAVAAFAGAGPTTGALEAALFGVGSSLVASVVFSIAQMLLANQAFDEVVRSTVRVTAEETSSAFMELIQTDQMEYLPIRRFESTAGPGNHFNADLTRELRSSQRYVFHGMTGRYVGPRLERVGHRLSEVTVIVGDPNSDETVVTRVQQLMPSGDGTGESFDDVRAAILADLELCLIGAFLGRLAHDRILICLTPAPPLDRFEIVDSAIYLSLFSDRNDRTSRFPRTLKFASVSAIYQTSLRSANRTVESGATTLRLTPSSTIDDLRRFYADVLDLDLTDERFAGLRGRYSAFAGEFFQKVGL